MKAQRFALWLHVLSLLAVPASVVMDAPAAHAQVQREPTTALGHKVTSKVDEGIAIAIKVCTALLVFYALFIIVKLFAGQGREALTHLLFWTLGAAILASVDQLVQWSQS